MQDRHALDDTQLIAAVSAGEREAFTLLVERHAAAVHRLARAMTGSSATADDVSQDVFVSAWRFASAFRGGAARAWLLTITRNAVHRTRRRRAGQPVQDEPLDELAIDAGWGKSSTTPDFERALESRELLTRAMERLREEDREVLTLVDLEGLTLAEGASILELEVPALKSRLHRARIRFHAAVRELSS